MYTFAISLSIFYKKKLKKKKYDNFILQTTKCRPRTWKESIKPVPYMGTKISPQLHILSAFTSFGSVHVLCHPTPYVRIRVNYRVSEWLVGGKLTPSPPKKKKLNTQKNPHQTKNLSVVLRNNFKNWSNYPPNSFSDF